MGAAAPSRHRGRAVGGEGAHPPLHSTPAHIRESRTRMRDTGPDAPPHAPRQTPLGGRGSCRAPRVFLRCAAQQELRPPDSVVTRKSWAMPPLASIEGERPGVRGHTRSIHSPQPGAFPFAAAREPNHQHPQNTTTQTPPAFLLRHLCASVVKTPHTRPRTCPAVLLSALNTPAPRHWPRDTA